MALFLKESLAGLFWASILVVIFFTHYFLCNDIPPFRYLGF